MKYQMLDRVFLYEKGLDDRNVFKHVVYAPGRWTGYSGVSFLYDSFKWAGYLRGYVTNLWSEKNRMSSPDCRRASRIGIGRTPW